jgi:hypothetical protein
MHTSEKLFLQTIGKFIAERYERRISNLEAKVEELETQRAELPLLAEAYQGVWKENRSYRRGQFATYRGGLWHANTGTMSKPGTKFFRNKFFSYRAGGILAFAKFFENRRDRIQMNLIDGLAVKGD